MEILSALYLQHIYFSVYVLYFTENVLSNLRFGSELYYTLPSFHHSVQVRLMALETWKQGGGRWELRVEWGAVLLKWLHCGALKKGGWPQLLDDL